MKLIVYILLLAAPLVGCADFLDIKPNQKMAVPKTLEQADILLNDYSSMNTGYPNLGEIAADDYYLNSADLSAVEQEDEKLSYNWSGTMITMNTQWQNPYKTVYLANQVLEILQKLESSSDFVKYKQVMGGAHFFRAFAFHQLASVFTLPYNPTTAPQELGIPLRLDPALDYRSIRSSLEQTYQQIINDYNMAIGNLSIVETRKGRPHKAAAYAGLARVYLDMQDYAKAYAYADSSLSLKHSLMQYSMRDHTIRFPFERFNEEVLFPATMLFSYGLDQFLARVDPELYEMYADNDYRKQLYFQHNDADPETYGFRGSYDNSSAINFIGLTTGETYLIRAECAVRINRKNQALADINMLLSHRLKVAEFLPITESDPDKLLRIILGERRKELMFRGRRWSDLKRLNQDVRFKKTLIRVLDGREYRLEPNSLKYAHLIPELAIMESGMTQNKR
ncbi:hypothetical protein KO02_05310 [Sphingobacterium sp. ML3W]|uniref:RagB/SusD family nutrient uptake outer membrane protein n=1 Tax=Sphingobacterium sp. ML3W TaxID=1538644 RepID=UPI0004F8B9E6|nr:RagB/SusD family nutrient uptake outer membrane protein [Sphingobacterium sp. ML3W]AIM36177.1 hypothetical protein KO02_05310 [Sphingobacterium sp. ML3W]